MLCVDACRVGDVEAPEVAELARGVNLGLVHRLRLTEHGRSVQPVAPWSGQELGGAQEDRGSILPGCRRPIGPGTGGRVDSQVDVLRLAQMHVCQHVILLVRHDGRTEPPRMHVVARDDQGNLDPLAAHAGETLLQGGAFARAGGVGSCRLVERNGRIDGSSGTHGWTPSTCPAWQHAQA